MSRPDQVIRPCGLEDLRERLAAALRAARLRDKTLLSPQDLAPPSTGRWTWFRLTQQEPSMQSDLYVFSVPIFVRHLHILNEILLIAEKHATEHNITPAALLSARLYPDMFPLTGQVRAACDTARRSTARVLGMEPPSSEDADKTFGDMQERIKNASAYVDGHPADAFQAAEQRMIDFPLGKESVKITSREYLTRFSLPNFYFHVTTAYDILRHNGVMLGKRDYLGAISGA